MDEFREILKDLIIDSGLPVRRIANESNTSATQIGRYLKGAYPSIESAVRLSNYFDCSLDYLFGLTEIKKSRPFKQYDIKLFLPRYKEVLEINKTTHWKFCKESGLNESAIRHWKYYGESPSIESLIIIADGLSSSIDYLIGRY